MSWTRISSPFTRGRLRAVFCLVVLALGPGAVLGQDRQINTDDVGIQESPRIAGLDKGGLVIVWADRDDAITMRRFTGNDEALDPFDVEVATGTVIGDPDLASSQAGEFVVVWRERLYQTAAAYEVRGQRFGDDGMTLGAEFQANVSTANSQFLPAVDMREDGSFTVVWHDGAGDGSASAITGRRFDSSGAPVAGEFRVNSQTAGTQTTPDLTYDPGGGLIVVWSSASIALQRYDSLGMAVGGEITVSEDPLPMPPLLGVGPAVAAAADGTFLVTWPIQESEDSMMAARVFDAAGSPLASELLLDDDAPISSSPAAVALGSEFEVAWHDFSDTGFDIVSRRISATGDLLGAQTTVNSTAAGSQRYPSLVARGDGRDAVWASPDSDRDGIFSNLMTPPEIFEDGFESGDTSAWSSSVP